jgi:hypothetical protein
LFPRLGMGIRAGEHQGDEQAGMGEQRAHAVILHQFL